MKVIRSYELVAGSDRQVIGPTDGCVVDVVDVGRDASGARVVWVVVDLDSSTRRPWVVWQVLTGRPVPPRAAYVGTIEPPFGTELVHVFARRVRSWPRASALLAGAA